MVSLVTWVRLEPDATTVTSAWLTPRLWTVDGPQSRLAKNLRSEGDLTDSQHRNIWERAPRAVHDRLVDFERTPTTGCKIFDPHTFGAKRDSNNPPAHAGGVYDDVRGRNPTDEDRYPWLENPLG